MSAIESRTVDWWPVHQFAQPLLEEVKSWPLAGTLTWQHLPEDHPAKLAAIYDAAQHWALRVDSCQEAMAEASREVAAAVDWPGIAREILQWRKALYIPRAAARRWERRVDKCQETLIA